MRISYRKISVCFGGTPGSHWWNHGVPRNPGCQTLFSMGVRRGSKRAFAPLEIGTKNQNFFGNMKLEAHFRVIHLIVAMTVSLPVYDTDNHTAQELDSLFWCHAVVRLQFARALCFACRGRLRTLLADCSTVGLY